MDPACRSYIAREGAEAAVFLVVALVLAVTWLVLGFRPGVSVMANDGPQYFLPMLAVLSHTGGNWAAMLYRPEYFGGTNILGLYGLLPVSILLARLGFPPVWNLNVSLYLVLVLLGYFVTQGARRFASAEGGGISRRSLPAIVIMTWISAFAPVIAWRIDAGHLYYLTAATAVQATLAVWVSAVRGALTTFMLLLAIVALTLAFCVQGFQILVYAAVFCAPLVFAMASDLARSYGWPGTLVPIATCLAAVCVGLALAAPIFIEMLGFAVSGDSPRSLGGHDMVTYSYFTGTWRENLNALFWFDHHVSKLPAYQQLEVYYGIGPMLLLAAIPAARRQWIGPVALAASVLLAMAFVSDVEPISDWLAHVPLIADYRVPTRVFLPLALVWGMMGCGYLLRESDQFVSAPGSRWLPILGAVAVMALGLVSPAAARETLVWLLTAVLIWVVLSRRPGAAHVVAVLVFMNLVAFARHVHMVGDAARVLAVNRHLGQRILAARPRLAVPLVRADMDTSDFGYDLSPVGRVAGITGYGFPHRRFSVLMHDLVNAVYSPTRTYFDATSKIPEFPVAQQLYDIQYGLAPSDDKIVISDLAATPGPVWVSERRQWVDSQHDLDTILKQRLHHAGWQATQYVDGAVTDSGGRDDCQRVSFGEPYRDVNGVLLDIPVKGRAAVDCPVTVSMTWSGNLHGAAVMPGETRAVALYPAYGSLTGLMLPAGTRTLAIRSTRRHAILGNTLGVAGLAGALALIAFGRTRPI